MAAWSCWNPNGGYPYGNGDAYMFGCIPAAAAAAAIALGSPGCTGEPLPAFCAAVTAFECLWWAWCSSVWIFSCFLRSCGRLNDFWQICVGQNGQLNRSIRGRRKGEDAHRTSEA